MNQRYYRVSFLLKHAINSTAQGMRNLASTRLPGYLDHLLLPRLFPKVGSTLGIENEPGAGCLFEVHVGSHDLVGCSWSLRAKHSTVQLPPRQDTDSSTRGCLSTGLAQRADAGYVLNLNPVRYGVEPLLNFLDYSKSHPRSAYYINGFKSSLTCSNTLSNHQHSELLLPVVGLLWSECEKWPSSPCTMLMLP